MLEDSEELGERLRDKEALGLLEEEGDMLVEALGLLEEDGEIDRLALGDREDDGDSDKLADALGDNEDEGDSEAEGLVEALGEREELAAGVRPGASPYHPTPGRGPGWPSS